MASQTSGVKGNGLLRIMIVSISQSFPVYKDIALEISECKFGGRANLYNMLTTCYSVIVTHLIFETANDEKLTRNLAVSSIYLNYD